MTIYGKERRRQPREKKEFKVDIKTGKQTILAYSIDFSVGGIKVGGAGLKLVPGEQVELSIEKDGAKFTFPGRVQRDDGIQRINRIGRDGNAFFVRIVDERLAEFVKAQKWFNKDEDRVAFAENDRLLDELQYSALRTPQPTRVVEKEGRSFALFSIRGPGAVLDSLLSHVKFREHDIIERFSPSEIRGVLTNLRQVMTEDITGIFHRLLEKDYPQAICIIVLLHAADQISDTVLADLDLIAGTMRPGEIQIIDMTK